MGKMRVVKLIKGGKYIEYKIGPANYVILSLIPIVGTVAYFVVAIQVKQFRGVWINKIIIDFMFIMFASISRAIMIDTGNRFQWTVYIMISIICYSLILYDYVINANYYSIKQRLLEGYKVLNEDEVAINHVIDKASRIKEPFWQLTTY